jgi:tRNA dimethylallyltransferase
MSLQRLHSAAQRLQQPRRTALCIKVYPAEELLSTLPPVVAIVGPTAVGKSRLAIELAAVFRADIVSADSRQVYRYMDIGTAKPTEAERAVIPHYMIDLVAPDDAYTVQRYRDEGVRVLHRIGAAGRVALAVGGTGFYLRALLDGLSLPPVAPDPELRVRLRAEAERVGVHALHGRLASRDPASAARIHPNNLPRVIRALEIVERLGGPVPGASAGPAVPALYLGLTLDRPILHQVADRRVLQQIHQGLIEETRRLLEMGYNPESPALQGFAYREAIDYLRGRSTLAEMIADYQKATHRYIRRQMTWFRGDDRVQWIDAGERPAEVARRRIADWLLTV